MKQGQQFSEEFITAWAKVLAAVRTDDLDKRLALERINHLIHSTNDADIRRFLRKMRRRIRWAQQKAQL